MSQQLTTESIIEFLEYVRASRVNHEELMASNVSIDDKLQSLLNPMATMMVLQLLIGAGDPINMFRGSFVAGVEIGYAIAVRQRELAELGAFK